MALGRAVIEIHGDTRPFRKDLDKGLKEAGKDIGPKMRKAAEGGLKETAKTLRFLPGTVQGGLIAGLAAALIAGAPVIAAALQSLMATAIGIAGIGAGIALAISASPKLQEAGKELGHKVLSGLQSASGVFIEPIERSIVRLGRTFDLILPDIRHGFAVLAPQVEVLVSGVTRFVVNVMPGLINAFEEAGPAIAVFSDELANFGTVLSGFLQDVTSDSEASAEGLRAVFLLLNAGVVTTGKTIQGLANAFKFLTDSYGGLVEVARDTPLSVIFGTGIGERILKQIERPLTGVRKISEEVISSTLRLGGAWSTAAVQGQGLVETMRQIYNLELTLTDSELRFEAAVDGVTASIKENKRNFDINTAAGRANVAAVNEGVKAALAMHEAQIASGGSVAAANQQYLEQIERLRATLRAAGLTEAQIHELIGAYDSVPGTVNTNVTAPGLAGVLTRAQELDRTLQSIHAQRVRVNIASGGSGIGGYAEGGIVSRPEIASIGEEGPEAIIPLTNPERANEVLSQAGIGTGTIVVQIVMDGKVIDERIIRNDKDSARRFSYRPRRL